MPAPPNDNFSAAILITALPYQFFGNNVGAGAEASEPINWGHTIWWRWVATSSTRFMASVRKTTALNLNNVPTIDCDLQVFQAGTSGLASLALVSRSLAGEAPFDAITGVTYYFRADGRFGKQGKIDFTFDEFKELKLSDCVSCGSAPKAGETCLGILKPDISKENSPSFGSFPRGTYRVGYCGGAWNYGLGWVVGRTPRDNPKQTWPGNTSQGYFLDLVYSGSARAVLSEPAIPNVAGYADQKAAERGAKCEQAVINHTGGPISLHFTDNEYTDNVPGTNTPSYALYRAVPALKVETAYFEFNSTDSNYMQGFVRVRNLGTVYYAMTFTLQTTGGVSQVVTAPPVTRIESLQTADISFTFKTTTLGKTDCLLTIKVSDGFNTIPDLKVDLTPILVIPATTIGSGNVTCNGRKWTMRFGVKNIGYGSTYHLVATIRNTGGIESVWDTQTGCTTQNNDIVVGQIVPFTAPFFFVPQATFKFLPTTGLTKVTVTIDWLDVAVTHPPAEFTSNIAT